MTRADRQREIDALAERAAEIKADWYKWLQHGRDPAQAKELLERVRAARRAVEVAMLRDAQRARVDGFVRRMEKLRKRLAEQRKAARQRRREITGR